ncbi:MAG: hypothetical protein IPK10_19680 [Bacteroidetes bacterium]|nr:hypothetical protein [Bacteroidota bacterium]
MREDIISKKKPNYPINTELRKYLRGYGRKFSADLEYDDLLRFTGSFPYYDKAGKDTLWESVYYSPSENESLNRALTGMYAQLKTGGDLSVIEHLFAERIDYCTFGNSKPFRVRIVNKLNDNFDYFYIKKADASRIYGLELEHILSPNRISYLVSGNTLIEEHIAGIPGDLFIKDQMKKKEINTIRIAKEFVKFNERCFLRLLGDMRSYNFVIDMTPDFEETHYRIRAIDFDQQSYEGKKSLYMPQFFKENNPYVQLAIKLMTPETMRQYQIEERNLIAIRIKAGKRMLKDLLDCMGRDTISTEEKKNQLKLELSEHYKNPSYLKCKNMGEIVKLSLKEMLRQNKHHLATKRKKK